MTYATNRALREEFYRAYMNRASAGATDNTPVIEKLLGLRQEGARLLGFANFAERAMSTKVGGRWWLGCLLGLVFWSVLACCLLVAAQLAAFFLHTPNPAKSTHPPAA